MSSVEKSIYYMESNGFHHGQELLYGSAAFLSVLFGALIANYCLFKEESKN